jgi:xanthine dehydrogenase accessory factor
MLQFYGWSNRDHMAKHVDRQKWRLFIVGSNAFAASLARFAEAVDYAVTVCEPRAELAKRWNASSIAMTSSMPGRAVTQFRPDARSAVVAMSDNAAFDAMALRVALLSPAFYIAAPSLEISPDACTSLIDLEEDQFARVRCSAGLELGGRTLPERSLAIMADMTVVRNASREMSVGP